MHRITILHNVFYKVQSLVLLSLVLMVCGCKVIPSTSNKIYDVTKFGAIGDSTTISTVAIQKAIDKCFSKGGGTVLIPKGCFSSGALFLKENVNLTIAKQGKLRAIAGIENYPVLKKTRIAGIEMDWPSAFLNIINAKNVEVSGEGTLDGSGYYWWEDYWIKRDSLLKTVPGDLIDWYVPRPRLILFHQAENATLRGLKIQNAGFWTVHICYSKSIQVIGLNIFNPVLAKGMKAASSDGIDIDSSSDIFIKECSISVDDDCIAVKSGRGSDGLRVDRPTENVVIEQCTFLSGHGGVSIGTETAGGVRNVYVRNCIAKGNTAPIKFKPRPGRGGVIENIVHENWKIENAGTVIDYSLREVNGEDYVDEWQKIKVPFLKATPLYRNITIRQVHAQNSDKAISFLGWSLAHAENIILKDITIESKQGATFQFVDNLLLQQVKINAQGESFTFKEVTNLVQR